MMLSQFSPATGSYAAPIDIVIIVAYFIGVLAFGTYFGRFSKTTKDFFFGGQRFSWWLLSMSIVASAVGSYSFVKYSDTGFRYGLSSSMSYMNDWFFIAFFMFGWLPIIYFARVRSIPEYFERRFNTPARLLCAGVLLVYMLAYVAYNLYTLGTAANAIFPSVGIYTAAIVIAIATGIYITAGGQTAVIFTDLAQGLMLIVAGLVLVLLGLDYLATGGSLFDGLKAWWGNMTFTARLPFADFNKPDDFNFIGVFWQDMSNSFAFLFVNQGLIMRFLSAKSMEESRKSAFYNTLFLLPLCVIVVGGAGWMGNAIAHMAPDVLDPNTPGKKVFVEVAKLLCSPGVFGFVIGTLIAALMSTVDTFINAIAAVSVIDLYQPYLAKGRSDKHYLFVARVISVVTTVVAIGLVPLYMGYGSIYEAHAAFTAVVTPILCVPVFLGAFWRRYTPAAAMATMSVGVVGAFLSFKMPEVVYPFMRLHGWDVFTADMAVSLKAQLGGLVDQIRQVDQIGVELAGRIQTELSDTLERLRTMHVIKPLRAFQVESMLTSLVSATTGGVTQINPDDAINLTTELQDLVKPSRATYMRALFLIVIEGFTGVVVSLFTRPKTSVEIAGLWVGSIHIGRYLFKGSQPNDTPGSRKTLASLQVVQADQITGLDASSTGATKIQSHKMTDGANVEMDVADVTHIPWNEYASASLSRREMELLKVNPGDLVYITDTRWWLGGLRSVHVRVADAHDEAGIVRITAETLNNANLFLHRRIRIERIF